MSIQQRGNRAVRSTQRRRSVEMLLFLVASVIGIYGLGRGLTGLFEPGQGIDLLCLAITGVAMMMLFAQMRRVMTPGHANVGRTWSIRATNLSYCCLMHPFQKKQEHRPRSPVN